MQELVPVIVAATAAASSILAATITAWLMRRTGKESNEVSSVANEVNAFKVVTDQLLELNNAFRGELDAVKKELAEVKTKVALQEKELEAARVSQDIARRTSASLASYIKKLLDHWPVGHTPPGPDEALDWEKHLW